MRQIDARPGGVVEGGAHKREVAPGTVAGGADVALGGVADEGVSGRQYPRFKDGAGGIDALGLGGLGVGGAVVVGIAHLGPHVVDQVVGRGVGGVFEKTPVIVERDPFARGLRRQQGRGAGGEQAGGEQTDRGRVYHGEEAAGDGPDRAGEDRGEVIGRGEHSKRRGLRSRQSVNRANI